MKMNCLQLVVSEISAVAFWAVCATEAWTASIALQHGTISGLHIGYAAMAYMVSYSQPTSMLPGELQQERFLLSWKAQNKKHQRHRDVVNQPHPTSSAHIKTKMLGITPAHSVQSEMLAYTHIHLDELYTHTYLPVFIPSQD